MSARLPCGSLLIVLVLVIAQLTRSLAQDHFPADTLGRFLGFTVICYCFSQDPQALYYALLVEWFDSSYAEGASGFMRDVAGNRGGY